MVKDRKEFSHTTVNTGTHGHTRDVPPPEPLSTGAPVDTPEMCLSEEHWRRNTAVLTFCHCEKLASLGPVSEGSVHGWLDPLRLVQASAEVEEHQSGTACVRG